MPTLIRRNPQVKEETIQALETALRNGCTKRSAAAHAGVSHETLYLLSKDTDTFDRLRRAELSACALVEQVFTNAALSGNDWRASEAWLKRRMPEQWGDRLEIGKLDTQDLLRVLQSQESPDTALDAEFTAIDVQSPE